MMMSEDAARRIHARHWRQGRLLPVAGHAEIAQQLSGVLLADDDAVIVISQSCDLVHGDFTQEPFAEILITHRLPEPPDGALMYLRNPRRLHYMMRESCAAGPILITSAIRITPRIKRRI